MSSVSDILTSTKNIVTAINGLGQLISAMTTAYLSVEGKSRSATMASTTLVSSTAGRLASVSVIVAGSTNGTIYDSAATGSLTNALSVVANTIGVTVINLPYNTGLVVVPGTGMTLVVSYSEG
jgi:hydroxyethylthiazole kinase-like sugar kinase family protein